MVPCWKLSEQRSGGGGQTSEGLEAANFPHKLFWLGLSVLLLLVTVMLGLTGHLGLPGARSESLQSVRITASDQTGVLLNQSAFVDRENNLLTFWVTSPSNQTSTVVFDVNHGLICYRPSDQDGCFLRTMEPSDHQDVNSILREAVLKEQIQLSVNATQRRTEFLGVLAASRVNSSSLEEPLRSQCQNQPVHWTRRADGPGKQRLVYFCIDICFPSNVCVSVCFYYLPE